MPPDVIIFLGGFAVGVLCGVLLARTFFRCRLAHYPAGGVMGYMEKQHDEKQKRKERILVALTEKGSVTNSDVEALLGVSDATATNYCDELEQEGAIEQVGRHGRFVTYRLRSNNSMAKPV